MTILADAIREEMEHRGWTAAQLSAKKRSGIPLGWLLRILDGTEQLTYQAAEGLGRAFGTSPRLWETLARVRETPKPTDTTENADLLLDQCIDDARKSMGGDKTIFCTAGVQKAFAERAKVRLPSGMIVELMARHSKVVRLSGGAYWFWLPDSLTRYQCDASDGATLTSTDTTELREAAREVVVALRRYKGIYPQIKRLRDALNTSEPVRVEGGFDCPFANTGLGGILCSYDSANRPAIAQTPTCDPGNCRRGEKIDLSRMTTAPPVHEQLIDMAQGIPEDLPGRYWENGITGTPRKSAIYTAKYRPNGISVYDERGNEVDYELSDTVFDAQYTRIPEPDEATAPDSFAEQFAQDWPEVDAWASRTIPNNMHADDRRQTVLERDLCRLAKQQAERLEAVVRSDDDYHTEQDRNIQRLKHRVEEVQSIVHSMAEWQKCHVDGDTAHDKLVDSRLSQVELRCRALETFQDAVLQRFSQMVEDTTPKPKSPCNHRTPEGLCKYTGVGLGYCHADRCPAWQERR